MTDKSKGKKVITHFSAQQPKVAGSTLTMAEKRAIMKQHRRNKQKVKKTSSQFFEFFFVFNFFSFQKIDSARGTPKKIKPAMSPKKLEEIKERAVKNAEKYRTKLRKRTPPKRIVDPFKDIEHLLKPQKQKKVSYGKDLSKKKFGKKN